MQSRVSMPVDLSLEDTNRFGVRTAKGCAAQPDEVKTIMDFCRRNAVEFLIVRCPVEQMATIHALEDERLHLMDTLVFFARSLKEWSPRRLPPRIQIRPLEQTELDIVRDIASHVFHDYPSHYHADPRLDREACEAVYVDWSVNLCRAAAHPTAALLAFIDGTPVGYMAFRWRPNEHGEAVLGGVRESARKHGVYQALLASGIDWLHKQGCPAAMLSSQISNVAVQKVWTRLGFEPHHAVHTFHGWF